MKVLKYLTGPSAGPLAEFHIPFHSREDFSSLQLVSDHSDPFPIYLSMKIIINWEKFDLSAK